MIAKGLIEKIDGSTATVRFYKDVGCASCSSCSEESKFGQIINLTIPKNRIFSIGDSISIEMDDMVLLKLSFILYIIPALAMIAGYFILNSLGFSEVISIVGSFLALALSFGVLYIYDKKRVKDIGEDFIVLE